MPAACSTSSVSMPRRLKISASSLISAILTSRCVFSITLAASATRMLEALCVPALMMLAYSESTKSATSGVEPEVIFLIVGQAMLLVARVDALGAVAAEEVAVELQARQALENRHGDLFGAAGIDGRFEHDDVALLQHLADQLARALDRLQVRALVAVDRRRHRDDEDLARAQVLDAGRVASGASPRAARPARTSSVLSCPVFSSATRAALMSKPTVWKCLPNSTASGSPT